MNDKTILEAIFEDATLGILVVDGSGKIMNINAFAERMFGYEKGELEGKQLEILLPASFRKMHIQHRQNYFKNPSPRLMGAELELSGIRKNGEEFPVEISLSYVQNAEGAIAIAYINDTSDEKTILRDLKKYKYRLDEAQELGHFGSFEWNLKEEKLSLSDEMYRILGFEPQAFVMTLEKYYDSIHPEDLDAFKRNIEKILQDKIPFNFEYRIVTPKNEIRHLRGIREVELDKDGNLLRFFGLLQDVTEKKRNEKELLIKNTAITSGIMPVAFANMDAIITEVNEAFVKMWGYENAEEIIGMNIIELSSTKKEALKITSSIKNKGSWSGEAIAKKKDGSFFAIFLASSLIKGENGLLLGMQASFIDISELKKVQKLNQDISKIVEDSLNEIFIFNAVSLKFIQVNRGARNNLGYTLEEMEEMTLYDIKPEHTKATFEKLISPLINGEKEILVFDTIHQRKNKTTYPAEVHLQYSTLGNQPVYVAIVVDITKSTKAKQEMEKLNIELEEKVLTRTKSLQEKEIELKQALEKEKELGELKSRFVSMASHEFRTPLSSILSSAGLISQYVEADKQDKRMKHVNRIESSVDNLTTILNDFLSLEKLESGKININKTTVDFFKFSEAVLDEIKLIAKKDQKIVHHHLGNPMVIIDEHLVKNIMFNLLSNAVKYTLNGELVDLTSKIENGYLIVEVRDEGIGIPEEDQVHLFSRFFRASNATAIKGTGLGLTIVKRYLDLMNGTISFVSKENEGSTFRVAIPQ